MHKVIVWTHHKLLVNSQYLWDVPKDALDVLVVENGPSSQLRPLQRLLEHLQGQVSASKGLCSLYGRS